MFNSTSVSAIKATLYEFCIDYQLTSCPLLRPRKHPQLIQTTRLIMTSKCRLPNQQGTFNTQIRRKNTFCFNCSKILEKIFNHDVATKIAITKVKKFKFSVPQSMFNGLQAHFSDSFMSYDARLKNKTQSSMI